MAVLRAEYINNKSREMVLLDKWEAVVSKYQLRRILLDGVEEVMSKVFQVRISQIENIRDAFDSADDKILISYSFSQLL